MKLVGNRLKVGSASQFKDSFIDRNVSELVRELDKRQIVVGFISGGGIRLEHSVTKEKFKLTKNGQVSTIEKIS